ncbi:hypothetical protein LUX57_01785 [Actinomadura madurae]|uniref:hypothetical protein n=1 Tax=Actinomadura madurae TaxID=1993 RepID=UPI0020D20079|nr:hypothetical protein [Actinomadura madurae]MCP9964081.1 hypothetical protein [Actinomadura madurae]
MKAKVTARSQIGMSRALKVSHMPSALTAVAMAAAVRSPRLVRRASGPAAVRRRRLAAQTAAAARTALPVPVAA